MRSRNKPNGRLSVALVFARVHRGASQSMWPAVADEAERGNLNLFCFPGGQVGSTDPYETSRNSVFSLAAEAPLDGALIWASALSGTGPEREIDRFVDRYRDIPAVGISAGVTGIPVVTIDFHSGMRDALSHMIDAHGFRSIAFVRGPERHPSAEDRYRAYRDVLRERGIAEDPELVTSPRDWDGGRGAVAELLDDRKLVPGKDFRAIAMASDLLALWAMMALRERGWRIPEDVAVIGMNDIVESRIAVPPLTTMHAPFPALGVTGLRTLLDLIEGKKVPPSQHLPARLIVRRSCGCPSDSFLLAGSDPGKTEIPPELPKEWFMPLEADWNRAAAGGDGGAFFERLEATIDQLIRNRQDIASWQGAVSLLRRSLPSSLGMRERLRMEDMAGQARVLLAEGADRAVNYRNWEDARQADRLSELNHALLSALDMAKLSQILIPALSRLGIRSAYICRNETGEEPGKANLAFGLRDGQDVSDPSLVFPSADLLPRDKFPDRRLAYIVEPLYFHENPIGYALLEIGPRSGILYEELRDAMSNALRTIILFARIETARALAERSNTIKTRLLSNVSHELRSPVNQILQSVARLSAHGADSDPEADLARIKANAEHQKRLVGDLLDISRAEIDELDVHRELTDVGPLSREVFAPFAAGAAAGVEWRLELPDRLPLVMADPTRFRQILFNLLGNAEKFTVAGSVSLRIEAVPARLLITVADTGPGISAQRQAFVFEPFISSGDRTDGPGGIGLGLSITRHLVSLHFGRIEVRSREGEGATFLVELPLPNLEGSTRRTQPAGGGCILLLSASSVVAAEVQDMARRLALPVRRLTLEEAESGGLDSLMPEAVVWDLSAAGGAEWSLFRKIRQHPAYAALPFMLYGTGTTGFLGKDAAEKTLAEALMILCPAGGDAPILIADDDPLELEKLRAAIRKTLPGIDIVSAGDGNEAWEGLRTRSPRLAILDLVMPGLSGFDLVDRLRADERWAALPVMLLTNKVISSDDVKRVEGRSRVLFQNKGIWDESDLGAGISRALYGEGGRLPQSTSAVVKRVIAYLNGNYRTEITRWKLAEAVCLSEYYVSRIFRRETGITVWEYLTRLRVHRAKELLASGADSVAAVGGKVGFPDQAYFSRVFKKATGMSPVAWRDSIGR